MNKTTHKLAVVLMLSSLNIGYGADVVEDGTYVGINDKRAQISSYLNQNIHQYNLILTESYYSDDYIQFHMLTPKSVEIGKPYIFKAQASPYDEETKISQCKITATWSANGELDLTGDSKCVTERSKLGMFLFSKQASFLPDKFTGKWGKTSSCTEEYAVIYTSMLTNDRDYGMAAVLNTDNKDDGSTDVYGVETYEDILSSSNFNLKLIGNKLHIKGHHHASDVDEVLVKCANQADDVE